MKEFLQRHGTWLGMLVLLGCAFHLRSFHLDAASIGYHNMKENEYLAMAWHMAQGPGDALDWLRRQTFLCQPGEARCYFEEYPQMPLIPWMLVALWKVVGFSVAAGRAVMVLFSLASMVVLRRVLEKLGAAPLLVWVAVALLAVMPLAVFFGRNIQPESPALFFMLLGMERITAWRASPSHPLAGAAGLAFGVTALLKPTFLIGLLPILAAVPWRDILSRRAGRPLGADAGSFLLGMAPWAAWTALSGQLNTRQDLASSVARRVDLGAIFHAAWWQEHGDMLLAYALDNFTHWGCAFTLLGILVAVTRRHEPVARFILLYVAAVPVFLMVTSDFASQHSYYQMPFLPLVCVASGCLVEQLGRLLGRVLGDQRWAPAALLMLLPALPELDRNITGLFDTVFFGEDTAAAYLSRHSAPHERLWVAGQAQSLGVCFNARRQCSLVPDTVAAMEQEEVDGAYPWLFIHGALGMQVLQAQGLWEHVRENYRVVQLGVFPGDGGLVPEYFLLRRGGAFRLEDLRVPEGNPSQTYALRRGGSVTLQLLEPAP